MKKLVILYALIIGSYQISAQNNSLEKIDFIIGNWKGTGAGFGNSTSTIKASYNYVMDKKYIEVKHESNFKPTEKNTEGEHHIDKGFISFDTLRNKLVYRQFNNEGYINQYILNDSISNKTMLVFETEEIENFMPGGKARFTIKKIGENELETIFDVSFPNKEYSCFGTNKLMRE